MTPDDSLLQLQQQLRDIRDLDPVSAWPPGPGWWLLLIMLALLLAAGRALLRHWHWSPRRLRFNQRWQRDASRRLAALQRRIGSEDSRVLADEFSALLRRIAVARHGRAACASLTGMSWLEWLSVHDPDGYDWTRHRRLLVDQAYAPPEDADHGAELHELTRAAQAWTRADAGAPPPAARVRSGAQAPEQV